jgi:SprT protein
MNNQNEFVDTTVPHEVCHLIAHQVYGRNIQAHGNEWKYVMSKLGQEPTRCHSMKVEPARKLATYSYTCKKCGKKVSFTSIAHKRAQKDSTLYSHRNCGGYFIYSPEEIDYDNLI